jgi:beta-galactosidase
MRFLRCSAVLLVVAIGGWAMAGRHTMPLDGTWSVEDTRTADASPQTDTHQTPVPGMINLAQPAFADVDRFDSREMIERRIREKTMPASERTTAAGVARQQRNYFWLRRTFRAPAARQVAFLKVNKAQFGTAVWLNGKKIGEHLGCFTAGYFNLAGAILWGAENELVIRIGAHPAVLPPSVACGTDFEKIKWTPGIYDSVSLEFSDNPRIESVQVAPRIRSSEILVETVVKNYLDRAVTFALTHRVKPWNTPATQSVTLRAGERKTLTATVKLAGAKLWSPESPTLYTVETSTGGDSVASRFGMREFRFDTATKRAYLNGKLIFLRGSNITLHRFFEDPKCGALPWNEKWVRKLLVEIPHQMNWNSFRFCIGPVPDKWLEIADEAGLLIQNEFFIWTGRDKWHTEWDTGDLITQYKEWMRDNWNHPSVAIWDSCNETNADVLGDTIIPAVRGLDRSNRPWENGYNLPQGPDDPIEDHPYLFSRYVFGEKKPFRMEELEKMFGTRSKNAAYPSSHALILNEYDWLWLNRDGTSTELTKPVYDDIMKKGATAEERFATNAYLLAGLTEYWRAWRNYAAVLHFVYLTCSYPGVYTADHFRNVETLELEPNFADYMKEAFRPLGVYINFWQPSLAAGTKRSYAIMMINDEGTPAAGKLTLGFDGGAKKETRFVLPAYGQQTYQLELEAPATPGDYLLKATAQNESKPGMAPTLCRRRVAIH